ncbi:beta-lactamase-like protein [Lipomyces arxii]|uniref:beta-lactamase-like protein n=1 Tax=Lipomyces arxii TaxID=56418 RepID=UPI0034CDAD2E
MSPSRTIAVDAFRFGKIPNIDHYFLSHFHSDHYAGLSRSWTHGKIYCSAATGRLVIGMLNVSPEYVVLLDMDTRIELDGFTATLIDANHCPGSSIFVFETSRLRILHTGDFRATPGQLNHVSLKRKHVDTLYLDTTYLDPKYTFPSQLNVVTACAEAAFDIIHSKSFFASAEERKWLVVVGTYSIGKERVAAAIARKLGAKIYISSRKQKLYANLQDRELDKYLTTDPTQGIVHLVSLQEIRPATLRAYLKEFPQYTNVLGFRPTGWSYSPPGDRKSASPATTSTDTILTDWRQPYTKSSLRPARGSGGDVTYFDVPYSEHSSFRELAAFVTAIDVGRVIPTVNVGSAKSRDKMRGWYDKWRSERRRKIGDFQTEW